MLGVGEVQKKFREKIDQLLKQENMTYLDAIVHCCHALDIEYETAAKLLTKEEKDLLKEEAAKLHMLKRGV